MGISIRAYARHRGVTDTAVHKAIRAGRITPETDGSCHYFWAFARNYCLGEQAMTHRLREGVAGIFREDELILEAQQKAIDEHPDHQFYNLNIDAGSMWARKLIDKLVAAELPAGTVIPIRRIA